MKTDATPEVVYGILLERYYDELSKDELNASEKIVSLVKDFQDKGYSLGKIENTTSINKEKNYFFPKIFNMDKRLEEKEKKLHYITTKICNHLDDRIENSKK